MDMTNTILRTSTKMPHQERSPCLRLGENRCHQYLYQKMIYLYSSVRPPKPARGPHLLVARTMLEVLLSKASPRFNAWILSQSRFLPTQANKPWKIRILPQIGQGLPWRVLILAILEENHRWDMTVKWEIITHLRMRSMPWRHEWIQLA